MALAEVRQCPICKTVRDLKGVIRVLTDVPFLTHKIGKEEIGLFYIPLMGVCATCGVHWHTGRVRDETLEEYYRTGNYRENLISGKERRKSALFTAEAVVSILDKYKFTPTRHLDFGSAQGVLMDLVSWEAVGVELDETAPDTDLPVYTKIKDVPGTFDFISATEVLEHLINPLGVLRALRRKLRKRGKMLVAVPNRTVAVGAYSFHHLLAFDDASFDYMIDLAGLSVEGIINYPENNSLWRILVHQKGEEK